MGAVICRRLQLPMKTDPPLKNPQHSVVRRRAPLRLEEIAEILATGVLRTEVRQSSELSGAKGDSLVDTRSKKSGHRARGNRAGAQ